jgi:hypothetical protein
MADAFRRPRAASTAPRRAWPAPSSACAGELDDGTLEVELLETSAGAAPLAGGQEAGGGGRRRQPHLLSAGGADGGGLGSPHLRASRISAIWACVAWDTLD